MAALKSKPWLAAFALLVGLGGCRPGESVWNRTLGETELELVCRGNLETFQRRVLRVGVVRNLKIVAAGNSARVMFDGQTFETTVERGKYRGVWLKEKAGPVYFSYLPDDPAAVLKYARNDDPEEPWFSGRCRPSP